MLIEQPASRGRSYTLPLFDDLMCVFFRDVSPSCTWSKNCEPGRHCAGRRIYWDKLPTFEARKALETFELKGLGTIVLQKS
jgi:hypothetical protein